MSSRLPSTADAVDGGTRWLGPTETDAWRALAALVLRLPGTLDAQLQRDSGLTMFEYFVLSELSMTPGRVLRMKDLAHLANGSLSRLSNVVKRLEQRGWVRRRPDPQDGRYTHAVLTDAGWDVVVRAAPGHVEAVRRHVVDVLTPEQLDQLREIATRITDRAEDIPAACLHAGPPACPQEEPPC